MKKDYLQVEKLLIEFQEQRYVTDQWKFQCRELLIRYGIYNPNIEKDFSNIKIYNPNDLRVSKYFNQSYENITIQLIKLKNLQ